MVGDNAFMPARAHPTEPAFVTASEKDVWQRVVRQLDAGSAVLANVRVADSHKDHEADLVVLMPDSGIVGVEVKGGHVWAEDGLWYIERGQGRQRIDPVAQARDARYALRHHVEADPRWGSRGRVRWSHHLVLARTELDDGFALPDLPRWQVSGRDDLGDLGARLFGTWWRWPRTVRSARSG